MRIICWKHRDFIGVIDGNVAHDGFAKIAFQNSCDRDYDYDCWPAGINFFHDCVEDALKIPAVELMNFYGCEASDFNEDYARKTYLYDIVVEKLGLEDYFRDNIDSDDNKFVIFDISPEDSCAGIAEFAAWIKKYIAKKYSGAMPDSGKPATAMAASQAVRIDKNNPERAYELIFTDGYSIGRSIYPSRQDAVSDMGKAYAEHDHNSPDSEWAGMSYLDSDSALLYDNGENVYVWRVLPCAGK